MYRSHVLVCGGTGCTSSGSPQIMEALNYEIKKQGLEDEVAVVETGCHGLCALGPIMIVYPDATFYSMVQPGDIPEIVSEHLLKGRVVTRLLYQETVSPTGSIKAQMCIRDRSHIDRMPLGDITSTIHNLIVYHPDTDFIYIYHYDGAEFTLDTREMREILGGIPDVYKRQE